MSYRRPLFAIISATIHLAGCRPASSGPDNAANDGTRAQGTGADAGTTPDRAVADAGSGAPSHSTSANDGGDAASGSDAAPSGALSALARVPWEGGPSYWKQFANANAGGWSDPSFFPMIIWYNGISSDDEVQWDKAHGINTYVGVDPSVDFGLFTRNKVYWIGDQLNAGFDPSSPQWVGNFLDDEVDGRFSQADGTAWLQSLVDKYAGNGKFDYANFTSMVIESYMRPSDAQAYVNDFTSAVSLDMYWYSVPFCSWDPYQGGSYYLLSVNQPNCRTASSYGKTVRMLRQQDAADGKLQPIWNFIEDLSGAPDGGDATYITAGQLKGAVMSSVINEARGIVWFNTSFNGPCASQPVLRRAQVEGDSYCGKDQVQAMGEVNNLVHSLAPVINTQSYVWDFGPGLDTMLKELGGEAYVFAMIDGASQPGSRTFTLPTGASATSVEVVGERRSLPVAGGKFTDDFAAEFAYHVYRFTP